MLPLRLKGTNQGQRRKLLNKAVNDAYNNKIPFDSIKCAEEQSPVDKLFKINLANKYQNLEYIQECLRDVDMLYVSYALKCDWLINTRIIDPIYLEQTLYLHMTVTGKNKIKHWIKLKLKNKEKCHNFYEYYKDKDFNYAIIFLPKCDSSFILQEMCNIGTRITPKLMKLLCEQTPLAAEKYYKEILQIDEVIESYLKMKPDEYFKAINGILKYTPEVYFYIIENYFHHSFKRINSNSTNFIMKNQRNVFNEKPELYVALILDISTVAKYLTHEDAKEIIVKLAKAKYLPKPFEFSYKTLQPIVKKIDRKERSMFCKKVFEQKDFGETVKEAPYKFPSHPKTSKLFDLNKALTQNRHNVSDLYGRECVMYCSMSAKRMQKIPLNRSTELDDLYDHYRFLSFEEVFEDLKQKIPRESSSKLREYMFLVLVSKTDGRENALSILIETLSSRYINEATNMRSTIVRSLVKRAQIWRLATSTWNSFLLFAHDLGIDGNLPVICCEGLHAAVLHHFIQNQTLSSSLAESFINNFSTLTEYNLNKNERNVVHKSVTSFLLKRAEENKADALKLLELWLNTQCAYRVLPTSTQWNGGIDLIKKLVKTDLEAARPLLQKFYDSKVGRQKLLPENLQALSSDSMYVTAIRHSACLIEDRLSQLKEKIEDGCKMRQFLGILNIYWPELSKQLTQTLKPLHPLYASALAMISGPDFKKLLVKSSCESISLSNTRVLSNFYSNAHLARPRMAIEEFITQKRSQVAVANWIHTCNPTTLQEKLPVLLQTPKLAKLVLVLRSHDISGLFPKIVPIVVNHQKDQMIFESVKALSRNKNHNEAYIQDWDCLKSILPKLNPTNINNDKFKLLMKTYDGFPKLVKLQYVYLIYPIFYKTVFNKDSEVTIVALKCILDYIKVIDKTFTKKVLEDYFSQDFQNYWLSESIAHDIVARYPFYAPNETELMERFDDIVVPFLNKIKKNWPDCVKSRASDNFDEYLRCLNFILLYSNPPQNSKNLLDKIKTFCQDFIATERTIKIEIKMRLTNAFSEAIKQTALENPMLFSENKILGYDAVNIIGSSFGKLISEDIENFMSFYSPSARFLYCNSLINFVNHSLLPLIQLDITLQIVNVLFEDITKIDNIAIGFNMYNNFIKDCHSFKEEISEVKNLLLDKIKKLSTVNSDEIKFYYSFDMDY